MPTANAAEFLTKGFFGNRTKEGFRHFQQQATAIAGLAVGSDATTVRHAGQRFDSGLQQIVAGFALHMGNQAKATVVSKLVRMVEPTTLYTHHKRKPFFQ